MKKNKVLLLFLLLSTLFVFVIFYFLSSQPKEYEFGTPVRLTQYPTSELFPVFSPDGKKLAFTRRYHNETGTFFEIVVMNLETREVKTIFSFSDLEKMCRTGEIKNFSTMEVHRLSWHGNKIIFNIYCTFPITLPLTCELGPPTPEETKVHDLRKDKVIKMVMINEDGSNPQVIAPGEHPYWSPDGKKIVYLFKSDFFVSVCGRCGKEIHIMDLESGKDILVYSQNNTLFWPSFSPDGRLIVFSRREDPIEEKRDDIYIIDSAGNSLRRLTYRGDNRYPIFTPDGNGIVFVSNIGGKDELYLFDIKTGKLKRLTNIEAIEACCMSFSPDGKKLVFSALTEKYQQGFDIWIMDVK